MFCFLFLNISDGSGPKKTGPGEVWYLNVGLGLGPGFSPSLKAEQRAGPGLLGSAFNQLTIKNIDFMQNSAKLTFMHRAKILEK